MDHRSHDSAGPVAHGTMTETIRPQNDTAQDRQERRLQTAKRLLNNADTDAAVIEDCQTVLSRPGYDRSHSQARVDACTVRLALAQIDTTTKRTREARQVLVAVSGGSQ
ncbi:hypothetical protein C435_21909 [Haloarcula marismortui ATCC 33799]|uniref:Uncharacterized protein n=2 Tax=Haloarcula marismortui TaxID=2238 RepID=M0JKD8_9EURY|nr:hypothetical protein C435_21909 [Haloarcula californiae ATCC 33799]